MSDKEKAGRGFTVTDRRTVAADGTDGDGEEAKPQEPARDEPAPEPPHDAGAAEIDFGTFVMSMASSALMHLGELLPPGVEQPRRNLSLAKQTIDILGMLQEKTRGNLTGDEAQLVEHLLYDLRLKFVDAKKKL